MLHGGRNALEVSEQLGQPSIAFTLDPYRHIIPHDASAAAGASDKSEESFGGAHLKLSRCNLLVSPPASLRQAARPGLLNGPTNMQSG